MTNDSVVVHSATKKSHNIYLFHTQVRAVLSFPPPCSILILKCGLKQLKIDFTAISKNLNEQEKSQNDRSILFLLHTQKTVP